MNKFNDKSLSAIVNSSVTPIHNNAELEKIIPLTYQQIIDSNPPDLELILHPWLPAQGIAFIYAATGVGKTLFTLNVAYAIAAGGKFVSYTAEKPRKVLYLDGEMSYKQLHTRFMQIVKQQGNLDYPENWLLLTPEKVTMRLPKISSPDGQQFYSKLIKDNDIKVFFIDNLSVLSSIDENKADQWTFIQDWLIELKSNGVSVVIVHHAGKDKFGYRGTSKMLDIADTAISLQELSQDDLEVDKLNITKFKVEYQKHRSFGGKDALSFEVTLTNDNWASKSIEITTIDRILDMLKLNMTHQEIANELHFARSYISRLVRKAIKDGLIRD